MVIATDVQLALCKVPLPRLRGQSVCSFTFSVLLMMWEMFSAEHKRISSPSHSNECNSQNESVGVTCSLERGVQEVFASPFHLPVNMNGEEGNHCHTSRYSTRPPDCILDSNMLFFFPTGKPNVLAQRDWLIAWLPKNLHPPPNPSPHIFKSSSSSVLFLYPCLLVCVQMD